MARYAGRVGYAVTEETAPGVFEETYRVRRVRGDIRRYATNYNMNDVVNGTVKASHQIAIMADPYAFEHFMDIRWIEWGGRKFEVTYVEVARPRLILTIGGVYNANEA